MKRSIATQLGIVPLAMLAVGLVGCAQSSAPEFVLNREGVDLSSASGEERQADRENQQKVVDLLVAAFGTPDDPYVFTETGLDLAKIRRSAGPAYSDQQGYQAGLYRRHCVHCHGITGDGAGPTALFLNPYPRDYRQGVFKFTSTGPNIKPTTADLRRTIREGLVGTAMPSFALLYDYEIDSLVEYVKYLSIRGQTEIDLNLKLANEEDLPADRASLLEVINSYVEEWKSAEEAVVEPAQENLPPFVFSENHEGYQASVERGRKLFLGKDANCLQCHGPTGLGDGGSDQIYDDWNKIKLGPDGNNTPAQIAAMYTLPLQQLKPRNLRLGIYRGGGRPVDIYRRIFAGIKGTPMPAGKALQPEQIWDIVNYVLSLPYEASSETGEHETVAQRGF